VTESRCEPRPVWARLRNSVQNRDIRHIDRSHFIPSIFAIFPDFRLLSVSRVG